MIKARIEGYEKEKEIILKKINRGPSELKAISYGNIGNASPEFTSLDRIIKYLHQLDNLIYLDNTIMEGMEKRKDTIDKQLKDLKGIKYKIAYKKLAEGKTYKEIAIELNRNYDWVRHVGVEIFKKPHNSNTDS